MPSPSERDVETVLTREQGLERLANLATRLRIDAGAIKVRSLTGSPAGMSLSIAVAGGTLTKTCASQSSKGKNFLCLVFWLGDLVRNMERGIETFREAFYNEGARDLAVRDTAYAVLGPNDYEGDASREDALQRLERALERMGLSRSDARLSWDAGRNVAELRIRLRSARVVAKSSSSQRDVDRNIHALALWLQTKAKNYERGLESDMEMLFAANLLPA